jgi:hypothetical protein
MSDCLMHPFPGRSIVLNYGCEGDDLQAAREVMDAIDELRFVIEPLSANLLVGCRDKRIQWRDMNVDPSLPSWHIHECSLPETIIARSEGSEPQISQVPELTRESLIVWIAKALQQECPNSNTHEVIWEELTINAVRARIFNKTNFEGRHLFVVHTERGEWSFPLERRNGELWVDSPIQDFLTEPSFNFSIINRSGALTLSISVHWSLWTSHGLAEHTALTQAIMRIMDRGWSLEYCSVEFPEIDGCDASYNFSDSVSLWLPAPTASGSHQRWATARAIDALEELRPVLDPLLVDLSISGYRHEAEVWRDWDCDTEPLMAHWSIRASDMPETTVLEMYPDSYQISQVPEISREYLLDWIEKALQQEYSSATYALDWSSLQIYAVKARIYNEEKFLNRHSFKLKTRDGNWEFPLERKTDGLWVYGWYETKERGKYNYNKKPPLIVTIYKEVHGITLGLSVEWSLWKQKDSAEHNALREALLRIVARGWEVDPDESFQL